MEFCSTVDWRGQSINPEYLTHVLQCDHLVEKVATLKQFKSLQIANSVVTARCFHDPNPSRPINWAKNKISHAENLQQEQFFLEQYLG